MRTTNKMVMGLFAAISLLGCAQGPEGSDEVPDVNWEEAAEEGTIPQAAAEIMAAVGGTSNVAPQYFACPAYVTYVPYAYTSNFTLANDWSGIENDVLPIDQVSWYQVWNGIQLRCKTSQSINPGMYVKKLITGFSACSTSNDTPQADGAWFVCF